MIEMVRGALTSGLPELLHRWLDVTRLIRSPAKNEGVLPIPLPKVSETYCSLRKDRALKRRLNPVPAAIGANLNTGDAAATRPS